MMTATKRGRVPRVLLWDIETAHNIIAAFDLYNPNPATNVLQEWYIICAAWKWLGEKTTHSVSLLDSPNLFRKDPTNDRHVVSILHDTISSADAIVAHYGDNFDIKRLNARLAFHKFSPLPPVIQIDTYKIAKSKFKFNSNKLDYLAQVLGFEGKTPTSPGLWLRALRGDVSAIKEMVVYNKQDVIVLEKVYNALRAFVPAKANRLLFDTRAACPSCGGEHINYRGYTFTKARKYRRYQCLDCGAWGHDPHSTT